jgi:hypothetical protein
MSSSNVKCGSANKKAAAEFSGGGFFETNDRERGE